MPQDLVNDWLAGKPIEVVQAKPAKEEPKAEEPAKEEPKAEEPKAEEPKAEEPKAEEPTDFCGFWNVLRVPLGGILG